MNDEKTRHEIIQLKKSCKYKGNRGCFNCTLKGCTPKDAACYNSYNLKNEFTKKDCNTCPEINKNICPAYKEKYGAWINARM